MPDRHTDTAKVLLSKMTVREKIGQLNQDLYAWKHFHRGANGFELSNEIQERLRNGTIGSLYGINRTDPWVGYTLEDGLKPQETARLCNQIQAYTTKHSRLKIPLMMACEAPKGVMGLGMSTFPSPILYASSWDRSLIEELGAIAAREARSVGLHNAYGPILDLATDQRWGRVEECFGENPKLSTEIGLAYFRGIQNKNDHGLSADKTICTLKHFAAYANGQGARNQSSASVGERHLRENYLAPFEACIKAGALSVMSAYNDIDGIPCTANPWLLTDVLRKEWGFEGFVVSDGVAIDELHLNHHVAEDLVSAGASALRAGVDMSLWDKAFLYLEEALEKGKLTADEVNQATFRVLRAKSLLGLFENPYVDEGACIEVCGNKQHWRTVEECVESSIILLKNEANLLPLNRDRLSSIAVIGPNADNLDAQIGNYAPPHPRETASTLLDGIHEICGGQLRINDARGCGIRSMDRSGFDKALRAADESDVIILALGSNSYQGYGVELNAAGAVTGFSPENEVDCGEGCDRRDTQLMGLQLDLLKELAKMRKPIITILIQGRMHSLDGILEHTDGLFCAWYPGPQGGRAMAKILFGEVNPSGKLTVQAPRCTGQQPVYMHLSSASAKPYIDGPSSPIFPLGFGLSYTEFEVSEPHLDRQTLRAGETLTIQVETKNTGDRAGATVVQLYYHDPVRSVAPPALQLLDFKKIFLQAGEQQTVSFEATIEQFSFIGPSCTRISEAGNITIFSGTQAAELKESHFTIA